MKVHVPPAQKGFEPVTVIPVVLIATVRRWVLWSYVHPENGPCGPEIVQVHLAAASVIVHEYPESRDMVPDAEIPATELVATNLTVPLQDHAMTALMSAIRHSWLPDLEKVRVLEIVLPLTTVPVRSDLGHQ